jgi:hypothetical protein
MAWPTTPDGPWWAELPPERRWVHEYLHVNAEHVLGRPLTDVSDKASGGGIVACKAYDGETTEWVDLTDPHDVGPPWPDLSRWGKGPRPPAPRRLDTYPVLGHDGTVTIVHSDQLPHRGALADDEWDE